MATSTIVSSRPVLLFTLCLIVILATEQAIAQPDFPVYRCDNDKGNYSADGTFEANLNHLLSTLIPSQKDNGPNRYFYSSSYGNDSDRVYGMGLCRGDVNPDVCQSCLNNSTRVIKRLCPNQMEAFGWYDYCTLRYSNRSIFSFTDSSVVHMWYITPNVSSDSNIVDEYYNYLRSLLGDLKSRAVAGDSQLKFAAGNVRAPGFKTIYGLVQCTPNLSQMDCNNCLDSVFERIQKYYGTPGIQVITPSCFLRYEDYLYYNSTADESQAPMPSPPPPPPPLTNTTTNTQGICFGLWGKSNSVWLYALS